MRLIASFFAVLLFATPALAVESGKDEIADPTAPLYVEIAPFIVPVLGPKGPEEMVSLVVTLEVAPGEDRTSFIKARLPRLNDAYVQTLYGALDRKTVKRGDVVDVVLVKDKLMKATERVLGPGYVTNVLVQAVAQRKVGGGVTN